MRPSSWLLVPALALAAACSRPAVDDLPNFADGGLDALVGQETK